MATKKATGLISDGAEPKGPWQRKGPGKYYNPTTGKKMNSSLSPNRDPKYNPQLPGSTAKTPAAATPDPAAQEPVSPAAITNSQMSNVDRPYLDSNADALVNQQQVQAGALGNIASGKIGEINTAMNTQLDPNTYGKAEVFNSAAYMDPQAQAQRRQEFTDNTYNAYMQRAQPEMQKQSEDFEQMAANRGWTPGSEVYETQKKALYQAQEDQKQQIRSQAYTQSGQEVMNDLSNAQTANTAHNTSVGTAYDQGNKVRTQSLSDFGMLTGLQPNQDANNALATSYANTGLQGQNALDQQRMSGTQAINLERAKRSGAGPARDPVADQMAIDNNRANNAAAAAAANQPKSPSTGSQIAGMFGSGLNGFLGGVGKSVGSWFGGG